MQLADRQELQALPEVQQELSRQTTRLRHLLDRELKRARLAGSGDFGQGLLLESELGPLFEALEKIYRGKN